MKINVLILVMTLSLVACNQVKTNIENEALNIQGTWKLVSSQAVTQGDTVNTSPQRTVEMIKIINETHFAFFKHDLNKGKGDTAIYDSGSGPYTLKGDNYSEHLEYCSAREWEGHDFRFTVTLKHDTLIQRGIEKIENLNVDREITEVYVRMPK